MRGEGGVSFCNDLDTNNTRFLVKRKPRYVDCSRRVFYSRTPPYLASWAAATELVYHGELRTQREDLALAVDTPAEAVADGEFEAPARGVQQHVVVILV